MLFSLAKLEIEAEIHAAHSLVDRWEIAWAYGNGRVPGGPRGLQIRSVLTTVGIGGFDSHAFPPVANATDRLLRATGQFFLLQHIMCLPLVIVNLVALGRMHQLIIGIRPSFHKNEFHSSL